MLVLVELRVVLSGKILILMILASKILTQLELRVIWVENACLKKKPGGWPGFFYLWFNYNDLSKTLLQ